MNSEKSVRTALCVALLASWLLPVRGQKPPPKQPPTSAPAFTAKDIAGKTRSRAEFDGRGGVLYFFCGCQPCHEASRLWSQIQRGGAMPSDAKGNPSSTLIFFFGEKDAAKTFVQQTGLDPKQTGMVADPKMIVGRKFGVETCPRAFVLQASRRIGYTNVKKDDRAEGGSVTLIVSRVVQALRDAPKSEGGKQPAASGEQPAAPGEQAAASGGLYVMAEKGDQRVAAGQIVRPLGEFNREKAKKVEQAFVVENRGDSQLRLIGVESSCGCADTVLYPGDRRARATQKKPAPVPAFKALDVVTVAPGQKATLLLALDFGGLEPGRHRKYVWLLQEGTESPAATIGLDFVLISKVSAGTRRVEFGKVKAGTGERLRFTVTQVRSSTRSPEHPRLRSTNPNVTVTSSGVEHSGKTLKYAYSVSLLPEAPLGVVSGSLVLDDRSSGSQRVMASLGGEVVGEVRALPGTIALGSVRRGTERRQRVVLLLARDDLYDSLQPISSAPWLKAEIALPQDGRQGENPGVLGHYAYLEITVEKDAKTGPILENVTLRTPKGQRLIVPVVGEVR